MDFPYCKPMDLWTSKNVNLMTESNPTHEGSIFRIQLLRVPQPSSSLLDRNFKKYPHLYGKFAVSFTLPPPKQKKKKKKKKIFLYSWPQPQAKCSGSTRKSNPIDMKR